MQWSRQRCPGPRVKRLFIGPKATSAIQAPSGQPGGYAECHSQHQEAYVDEQEGAGVKIAQSTASEVAGVVPNHQDEPYRADNTDQRPGPSEGPQQLAQVPVAPGVHEAEQDHHGDAGQDLCSP
jgi:hypothetical protein